MTHARIGLTSVLWCAISLIAGVSESYATESHPTESPPDYARLPVSKAMAAVPGGSDQQGVVHSEANDLLASIGALRACESARAADQPQCELRRLNGQWITTGAEIKARLPAGRHPLHLWRIDGPEASVYLAGSVHILKPSLYPLPEPFEVAFQAADHLVLEVNVSAANPIALQQKTLTYASLPADQRIDQILSDALLDRLSASLARYGIAITQVATVKPAFLMNQLVLLRLMTLGYQTEYGIEQHFLNKVGDRDILELESIDQQLQLLFDQPMALQRQLLVDTLDQEADIEPLLAGLLEAWLSGDDDGFMDMFDAQSGESELARQFTEQLLDARNIGMAEKIRSYLDGSGNYFVLVGAAHLIGEQGIVALLAEQGIVARRLWSDGTMASDG